MFGQELESFSQKSGLTESGVNTMQAMFVLECEFTQTVYKLHQVSSGPTEQQALYNMAHTYELRVCVMYDKVIEFDETSGLIRAMY